MPALRSGQRDVVPTVVSGGATSSKDKKTWKVKKMFKKMGGQGGGAPGGNDKGNTSGSAPYPEGGSIGVPASQHSHFYPRRGHVTGHQIAVCFAFMDTGTYKVTQHRKPFFFWGNVEKKLLVSQKRSSMKEMLQIDECPLDEELRVPLLVRTCCGIVEERGLEVVGVYRVPGNSAAVNQLTEQVNRGEFRSE